MGKPKSAELSGAVPKRKMPKGTPFPKGKSPNPGGVSKEKRALLERMQTDDAESIYASMMRLVREGNPPAVLRAFEYVAGKPKEQVELNATVKAELQHDLKAEVVNSPERLAKIAAVLVRAQALPVAPAVAWSCPVPNCGRPESEHTKISESDIRCPH